MKKSMETMHNQFETNYFSKQVSDYLKLCQSRKPVETHKNLNLISSIPNNELHCIHIESFQIPTNNNFQFFSVNVSLFDTTFATFYGKTYTGPKVQSGSGTVVDYYREIMLRQIHKNAAIKIIFELVGYEDTHKKSCGWFTLGLSQILEDGEKITLPIFRGSPRCLSQLVSSNDMTDQLNKAKTGNFAVVSGNVSEISPQIENLIPQDIVFGGDEQICGVKKQKRIITQSHQPEKLRISDISLTISRDLKKSLEIPENDYTGVAAKVSDINLHLQLFNSWRFIDKSKRIHFQVPQIPSSNLTSNKDIKLSSDICVDFNCFYFSKDIALTFQLEYILDPNSTFKNKEGVERKNKSIIAGWTLWNPFMSQNLGCCPIFTAPCGTPISSMGLTPTSFSHDQIWGWITFGFESMESQIPQSLPTETTAKAGFHSKYMIPTKEKVLENTVDLKEIPIYVEKFQKMTLSSTPIGQFGLPLRNELVWLYSAGFLPVVDKEGNTPHSVSLSNKPIINYDVEIGDILQRNVLSLRFMAFSSDNKTGDQFSTTSSLNSLFFTFQFYNFDFITTDKVLLDLDKEKNTTALIKQPNSSIPGYQICLADEKFCGEDKKDFIKYLKSSHLHIDVWNANSLMLVGFCQLPLYVFLRQSKSAVECSCQLEIVNQTDLGELSYNSNGRLILQTVNVGYYLDAVDLDIDKKNSVIGKRIRKLAVDAERSECFVTMPLALRSLNWNETMNTLDSTTDPVKKRKIERMQKVRLKTSLNFLPNTLDRQKSLRTVEAYRSQNKYQQIQDALDANILVDKSITVSVGRAEFFEIEVLNFLTTKQIVRIEFDDPCLCVLTNFEEWRHYKMMKNIKTHIEKNLISYSSEKKCPVVFLSPGETVFVPFVYRALSVDSTHFPVTPNEQLQSMIKDTFHKPRQKITKIHFVSSDCRILIVKLEIDINKCPVTNVLRFMSSGNEMFKKNITIPTSREFSNPANVVVRCSTSDSVSVDLQTTTYPQELIVKTMVGEVPSVKHMMVFIYGDSFMTNPLHSLAIFVQSCQRLDLTCVMGQLTKSKQIIRGYKSSRNIKFFVSHDFEVSVEKHDGILPANSSGDFTLCIKPLDISAREYIVNMVDVDNDQLLHCWQIMTSVIPPPISKVFEVTLNGDSCGISDSFKRVSYRNTYSIEKTFKISCNRPDLVELRPSVMILGPYESGYIGMAFLTTNGIRGKAEIYVFVCDPNGAVEDSYMILLKII